MLCVALILSSFVVPLDTKDLLAQLGDPKFAVREKASKELARRIGYGLAWRLKAYKPVNAEARRRVDRLVDGYWAANLPGPADAPYLDSLNLKNNCGGCFQLPVLNRYWNVAKEMVVPGLPLWLDYRMATYLALQDLRSLGVPPVVLRPLLTFMRVRSEEYDRKCNSPRRLPAGWFF